MATWNCISQEQWYGRDDMPDRMMETIRGRFWIASVTKHKQFLLACELIENALLPIPFGTRRDSDLSVERWRIVQGRGNIIEFIIHGQYGFFGSINVLFSVASNIIREVIADPFDLPTVYATTCLEQDEGHKGKCPTRLDRWLAWNGGTVRNLTEAILREYAFDRMPILADALEDAGCENKIILDHCRIPYGFHSSACWVLELLMERFLK